VSPTATTTSVVIARRHNGPPATANGGYACGLLARHVDGPARVSLRRPVPLDTPLELERHDDGHVTLHDGTTLIAEADPALPLDGLDPPYRPTVDEAREAARGRPAAWPPEFDNCWVCSPRDDGLGVIFGPLHDRPDMTGAVLHAGAGATLAPEIAWAALDCPSYTPALWGSPTPSLLASLHAELIEPLPAGVPLAVAGWTLGTEGRKHRSATAILAPDARVLARAEALWIRLRA
jgi:hypothetical protein